MSDAKVEPVTEPRCPKCDSVEWFPGAACFKCGWEGSAAEAYELMRQQRDILRVAGNEAISLFVSCIRGGESWSEQCEAALDAWRRQENRDG